MQAHQVAQHVLPLETVNIKVLEMATALEAGTSQALFAVQWGAYGIGCRMD